MSRASIAQSARPSVLEQDCAVHSMDRWPILISEYHRRSDDSEFEAYLDFVISLLERKQRFVIVIDSRHREPMGRQRVDRMARWFQKHRVGLAAYVPGMALVSSDMSPVLRFAASAMMSVVANMGGNPTLYSFHARLEDAKAWALRLLAKPP